MHHLADLAVRLNERYGLHLDGINLAGGGRGGESDIDLDVAAFAATLRRRRERAGTAVPRSTVSLGDSLVARAGVAVCRVLAVRRDAGSGQLAAVNGEAPGNPAPRIACLIARTSGAADRPTTVVGRHGEPGDVIAGDIALPGDLCPGNLLAISGFGAGRHDVASRSGPRPAVIGVRDGIAQPLVRP